MNETQASLRENLRALPRGAWILFFGTFLNKFGTFVLPFLAIYMTRLGYSAAQAGLAVGAYGVGTLGACLLGGHLADRLGRRKTIVLSMGSVAVAFIFGPSAGMWLFSVRPLALWGACGLLGLLAAGSILVEPGGASLTRVHPASAASAISPPPP